MKKRAEKKYQVSQKGFSLIEIMVALAIGLLAIYAVYVIYGNSEQAKRNITAVNDAQLSGYFSTFLLDHMVNNSGSGFGIGAGTSGIGNALANCPIGGSLDNLTNMTLRPLPVAVDVDAAGNNRLFVSYGTSSLYPMPLAVANVAPDGTSMNIRAPLGFRPNSTLYAIGAGCVAVQINGNATTNPDTGESFVNLSGVSGGLPAGITQAIDMGYPERQIIFLNGDVLQANRWSINPTNGQWRVRNDPIISNVMGFFVQYGLDTDNDNQIDTWQSVTDSADAWAWQSLADAALTTVQQIRAIRLGLIIKSDEPDRHYTQSVTVNLFQSCPPGATLCTSNPVSKNFSPDANGLGWRYRAYETVVPIRNSILR